jgi:hypothetical protein
MRRQSPSPGSMTSWSCDGGDGNRRTVGRRGSPGSRRACPASGAGAGHAHGPDAIRRRPPSNAGRYRPLLPRPRGRRSRCHRRSDASRRGRIPPGGMEGAPGRTAPLAGARGSGLSVVASRRFLYVALTGRSLCADPAGLIYQRVRRESISLASFSLAPKRSLWDKEEPCSEARAIFSFFFLRLPSASHCAERKSGSCAGITPTGAAPLNG